MNNEKVISTNNFRIEKNTISFNDSLVQISNIAHINVEPVPNPKFPIWTLGVSVVGILGMASTNDKIKLLGILFLVFSAIYILYYAINCSSNEEKYLGIYLNSGHKYYIYCENKKFLKKVMRVMKYCINNHTTQKIAIDFNQCTLENSPINVGNEKEVINTITKGENANVNVTIKDWTLVQDELKRACENLPKSSKEYIASEEALKYAMNEDEDGLFKVFNKYSESFLSSLFKSVVSGVLVEIIKSMLL